MIKLGIECENLEDAKSRWGVGHLVLNLLNEYEKNLEWQKEFRLILYFNNFIPDDQVLKNPIFIKKVVGSKLLKSFNIFYHILMPLRAMFDGLDYMFFPAYMLPPLYLRKSVVTLTNDVYYEYKQGALPFKYKLAYRLFTNWAAKFATKILAISEASKKEVAKLYKISPAKIFVSKLGVRMIDDIEGVESKNYILYVGQMFPRRHAKEAILAFDRIGRQYPSLEFILVGRDKYKEPIIDQLIREINRRLGGERIKHFDYIEKDEDLRRLYREAKLAIYVSESEAFGLPPVEAAASGVPVVVMDNELNHELFGSSAFFSKTGSVTDIAEAINEGLSNEAKAKEIKEAYKSIIPQLSWYNFAKNFFDNVKK